MKKMIAILALSWLSLGASAEPVKMVRQGNKATLVAGLHFSVADTDALPHTMEAGLPSVPVKTLKIALPAGTALAQVRVIEGQHRRDHRVILPAASQVPMSWRENPPRGLKAVDAPSYRGSYPAARYDVSLQTFHGVSVALINVYPIQVGEDRSTLNSIDGAEVRLELKAAPRPAPLFAHQQSEVQALVDNPEAVPSYTVRTSADKYEYLILATDKVIAYSGANGLADFQKALLGRQLHSKVLSVESINTSGTGADLPEKIRNTIRQEYQASGIQYVLLAGLSSETTSETYIPARPLWSKIRAYTGSWQDDEEFIPSDMYYACLDGSYNSNHDDKWGEPTDGDDGGDVDFLCEVNVGRVPITSDTDLQNFVKKTIWTYNNPMPRQVLLLGEELFPELGLTGGTYMDQLMGIVTEHGFTTTGYGAQWQPQRMYDDSSTSWSGKAAQAKINTGGFSMVNHLGHSNETYNMRLSSSSIAKFTNPNPYFYYTQGCLAGRFIVDCFIADLVAHTFGAVAAVANSTYGLAPEDPTPSTTKTPGASQMLHRQFIHAIFGQGLTNLGKAHQVSKYNLVGLKSAQEIRWVNWSATYFGDPSLEMKF